MWPVCLCSVSSRSLVAAFVIKRNSGFTAIFVLSLGCVGELFQPVFFQGERQWYLTKRPDIEETMCSVDLSWAAPSACS